MLLRNGDEIIEILNRTRGRADNNNIVEFAIVVVGVELELEKNETVGGGGWQKNRQAESFQIKLTLSLTYKNTVEGKVLAGL